MDDLPKGLDKIMEDPLSNPDAKRLAHSIKGMSSNPFDLPEWKKENLQRGDKGLGRAHMTIKEQKESLPIYFLKA